MAFDRNGFLWMATGMGIVRFDGRNFREYNMSNTPALQSDRCTLICKDSRSDRLLFEPQFASHRILKITDDYQLKVDSNLSGKHNMACIRNNGIFSFANLHRKYAATSMVDSGGMLDKLDLNADLLTLDGSHAYARKDRFYWYLDDSAAIVRPLAEIIGHELKIEYFIGDIFFFVDRQNRFYAYKNGLLQKTTASPRFMKLLGEVDISGPYPMQSDIKPMMDNRHTFLIHKGDIMLLSITNGVLDYEPLVVNTPIRNIQSLIYDERYKIIYAGTATSGLYILKKQDFQRLFFSSDNFIINSLYAQMELPDGSILTSSGILNRHNKTNIPTPGIYDRPAFLRSSDGSIWYSSYSWLRKTDSLLHHVDNIADLGTSAYVGTWISSITETRQKDIFLTTFNKFFRVSGHTATLLFRNDAPGFEMFAIRQISDTILWLGTTNGILSYNLAQDKLHRLPGMENITVRTFYKAGDGSIWIGTYGHGFYKYVQGRFFPMPMDANNYLASVHCFMEDKAGYFWLPTNKGLFKVLKSQLDSFAAGKKCSVFYYYFDKSSGFATNEFNGGCTPCGIVTHDGLFSLPSLDGLVQFNPDSVTIVPPNHPIFVDRLTADEKKTLPADYFEQAQNAGPLVFAISSPYCGNPMNLHMEYSIPELDNKWHPLNNDGKLVLTGLHHADYTLTIRKQEWNNSYSYKTVGWTILPYWYETIWFRLLMAVVIISILPLAIWTRYCRQVKRAEQLERKIAERTEALSESNRVKEKMMAIILHDLRSPLRFLNMLAVHVAENFRRIPAAELGEMLQKFQNATNDLYDFAQDFVVWTNAQKEGFVVRQEKIVIREIVGEIVSLYEAGADIRNNTVLNLVPQAMTLVSDPHILKLIIRNITDNANKYTLNGEIKIEAAQQNGTVSIAITDTGRSMEKNLVADILNNTYRTDDEGQGFGYKIILELLAKISGRLFIDAPGSTGNRITLEFSSAGHGPKHHPTDRTA